MNDTCGPGSPTRLAFLDPDGWSSRTWLVTSLWGSTPFSGTLPRWGMTRGGELFELPKPGHLTSGSDSSSRLATPTAWLGRRPSQAVGDARRWRDKGRSPELSDQIAHLFPTPTARDWKDVGEFTPRPDKAKLPHTIRALGDPSLLPSDYGNQSSDEQLLFPAETEP